MPCLANRSLINHSSPPIPFPVLDLSFKRDNANLPWHCRDTPPEPDLLPRGPDHATGRDAWHRNGAARAANEVAASPRAVPEPTSGQGSPQLRGAKERPRRRWSRALLQLTTPYPSANGSSALVALPPFLQSPSTWVRHPPELRFINGFWKSRARIRHGPTSSDQLWGQLEHNWLPSLQHQQALAGESNPTHDSKGWEMWLHPRAGHSNITPDGAGDEDQVSLFWLPPKQGEMLVKELAAQRGPAAVRSRGRRAGWGEERPTWRRRGARSAFVL